MKTNIIFHKKIIKYFFTAPMLILSTVGCADLDIDPSEYRNVSSGGDLSPDQIETSLSEVYYRMSEASLSTAFYVEGFGGDDITTGHAWNKADFRQFDQRNVGSNNSRLGTRFNKVFEVIIAANSIIENSSSSLAIEGDTDLDASLGQVYFLRGFAFYHLMRAHGEIPLALSGDVSVDIKLSKQDKVFEQIESDLKEAEKRLPNASLATVPGSSRPSKGSARAFLARLYMDWAGYPLNDVSKYVQAKEYAKLVIDNADSHGFGLLDNCADLWSIENRHNKESLYTIVHARENGVGKGNRKHGRFGWANSLGGGWSEVLGEIKFFEDFPEGPRKEATYRTDIDWKALPKDDRNQQSPILFKTVGPVDDIPVTEWRPNRNDFMMRYAEVLLIYAEASGRSGSVTSEAWEALNKIRRRAEGKPFNTADASVDVTSGDIAELAFTERKWEFAGEFIRWYDLVRMEKVEEALGNRLPTLSTLPTGELIEEHNSILGSLSNTNYYAPIPAEVLTRLPSLGSPAE